jgi:hypothetical protein
MEEAGRFLSFVLSLPPEELVPVAAVLNTLGRFNGLAFNGLMVGFRGFNFMVVGVADGLEPEADADANPADGFADKDKTTFSPSSRFNPSSAGGDPDLESERSSSATSAFARSICSAINIRSRASSDMVARSFFMLASYDTGSIMGKRYEAHNLRLWQELSESYRSKR